MWPGVEMILIYGLLFESQPLPGPWCVKTPLTPRANYCEKRTQPTAAPLTGGMEVVGKIKMNN